MIIADFHPELPATIATVVPVLLVAFSYGVASLAVSSWWHRITQRPGKPSTDDDLASQLLDHLDDNTWIQRNVVLLPQALAIMGSIRFTLGMYRVILEGLIRRQDLRLVSRWTVETFRKAGVRDTELSEDEQQMLGDIREAKGRGDPVDELLEKSKRLVGFRSQTAFETLYGRIRRFSAIIPISYLTLGLVTETMALIELQVRSNDLSPLLIIFTIGLMVFTGISIVAKAYVGPVDPSEAIDA